MTQESGIPTRDDSAPDRDSGRRAPAPSGRGPEAPGFLARWALLAVCTAGMLAAAGLALAATVAARAGMTARVIVPDGFAGPGRRQYLRGYVQPSLRGAEYLLYRHLATGRRIYAAFYGGRVFFSASYRPAGTYRIEYCGMPYGPLAHEAGSAMLTVVDRGQPVYLVDARLAPGGADDATFRRTLNTSTRRSAWGFFHAGSLEELDNVRKVLRATFPGVPVAGGADPQRGIPGALAYLRRRLGSGRTAPIVLVTGEPDLLREVVRAGTGFQPVWVGPVEKAPAAADPGHVFPTLGAWTASLPAGDEKGPGAD